MIETLIMLFVAAVLILWSEIRDREVEDPCEDGHTWSKNFQTDRLECLKCGVKI